MPATKESVPDQMSLNGAQRSQYLMEWFDAVGRWEDHIMGVDMSPFPKEGHAQQMTPRGFQL